MKILGKEVSKKIKDYIASNTLNKNIRLVIIRVGEDPASIKYTNNKLKAAEKVGIYCDLKVLPEDIQQREFDDIFEKTIKSDFTDGIIVQLPIPKHLNLDLVNNLYNKYPEKDVDGFSELNVGTLHLSKGYKTDFNIPCTAKGCIDMIDSTGYDLSGKVALVIGRSNIVGRPVARMLEQKNATVIQCHSRTTKEQIEKLGQQADVVIVAIGKAHCYKTSQFPNATIFIDVGINVNAEGKLVGDLLDDANIAEDGNKYISPVPGGVGPMTVANLLLNTYNSHERRIK